MPFMQQQVTRKMLWIQIDGSNGTTFVPAEDVANSGLNVGESTDEEYIIEQYEDFYDGLEIHYVGLIEGFGARYVDYTDWSVFDTAAKAQTYLDENYPEDEDKNEEL